MYQKIITLEGILIMKFLIMRWLLLRREIISFSFREVGNLDHHFAIIGIACWDC